ncbi:MAG: sodium:solute symporter family protein [Clostridia bacterium]|nr:sodium:solute symporter family protein [Clostridia bacterium]
MIVKLAMLVLFFAITVFIGFRYRRSASNTQGFVLGNRSVGPWLTAFAYGTSYFSAVIFIGYAGQFGWKFGIASTWIGIGNALIGSLLAWVILGRRTRVMTQHLDSRTMPDFFGKRYDSKALQIASALIVFVFLIPYTASLYNGLSRLFEMAFNIPYEACVVMMSVLTAVYVILGGYTATAVNDFIQGIIMLFGIVAVIAAVLNGQGGFMEALNSLANVTDETVTTPGAFNSFFGPDPFNLLCVVILTSLGTWGLPQMVQKFYAIKSEKSIKTGTIVSTAFAFVVAGGCYFLGGFGRLFPVELAANGSPIYDSIIPNMLKDLPDILVGIVVVLVLSASMSTLSSLVLTSSSTLTLDFLQETCMKKAKEKTSLLTMRIFIAVFIVISAILAIVQYQSSVTFIAQLMGISWGALAGAFLAPFLYGLYWKGVTKASVWVSFVFGTGFMLANMFAKDLFPTFLQSPINAGAFVMLAGLILVPVVSLLTKKPNSAQVDEVFSCYSGRVTVPASAALPTDTTEE